MTILDKTGNSPSATTTWAKETVTITAPGEYQFVFVSGTYDFSGGRAAGAQLFIDDVTVTQATPSTVLSDSQLSSIAQRVQYSNTSNNPPASKTLTISAQDNNGQTAIATATININPVNDQPSFTATNPPGINEDAGVQTLNSWASFNPGPEETNQTATYTISNISNPTLFSVTPAVDASGTLTYTPAANAFGTSTFEVVVKDSGGITNGGVDTSTPQTFTVTVNPVNDAPSFTNAGNQTLTPGSNTAQTIANWASGFNFGPNETSQAVDDFIVNVTSGAGLFTVAPDIANDGTLTFTPSGTPGTATIEVQLRDNGGIANSGINTSVPATFDITIPPPPVNLSVSSATGTEADTTAITVTATAASTVVGDQTVDLALSGDATPDDFSGIMPTQITIPNGTTTGQVTFTIANDDIDDDDEIATLTISNPSAGIVLGTTTTQNFTITDNDTAGYIINQVSGDTSESGDDSDV